MADNALSTISPISSLPDEQEWGTIFRMAQQLVPTGFLPKGIDTAQKASAILLKGRELGIPPMQALGNIAIINGKPTIAAELMMAMVKRAYGREVIWIEESTDKFAKVGYMVHGKPRFYEYTIEMAEKANLLKNPTWNAHRPAMLRARTVSAVCRMEFPEVIGGMYTPGELGEAVKVDPATGEVTTDFDYEIPSAQQSNDADATGESPWNVANNRLHAIAEKHGITDADLHLHIGKKGISSLHDVNARDLHAHADLLESKPSDAKSYYQGLRDEAEMRAVNEALSAQIDGTDTKETVDDDGVIQGEILDTSAYDSDPDPAKWRS